MKFYYHTLIFDRLFKKLWIRIKASVELPGYKFEEEILVIECYQHWFRIEAYNNDRYM
jgi:hypothetical protein